VRSLRRLGPLDALCALLVAAWLVAWTLGILHRYFDYDEFEHLYTTWRIANGARPFYDFFEVHPPFLWYPLSLLVRAFGPRSVPFFALRALTAAGHVALLIAIAKNVSLSFARLPQPIRLAWPTFAVAVLLLGGHLAVTWYLLEFRLDAWPNALLLLAIHRYRRQVDAPFRRAFELSLVSTLTLLCAPKPIGLFVFFAGFSLIAGDRRLLRLAGMAAGGLVAVAVGCLFLLAVRLDPIAVYRLSLSYHAALNAKGGFGHALARAIWEQPALLAIVLAGAMGWLLVAGRRILDFPFELAIITFLVFQATFVSFGYPQYYGPWFLLGIALAPYLELALRRLPMAHRFAVAAALVIAAANIVRDLQTFGGENQTAQSVAFNRWAWMVVPPGAIVAGDVSKIPLYRQGVFYHLLGSYAPSGYATESVMRDMNFPPFSDKITPEAYDRELESARPALFVESKLLSAAQSEAIDRYLARHRAEYHRLISPRGPVFVRDGLGL
jgi:hypothetical protein